MIEVDFSDAGDVEFELLPPGWYDALVYDVKLETTSAGNRQFVFELNMLDQEHAGRKAWLRNTIGAKDKNFYLKKSLSAMGYESEGVVQINPDELLGRELQVLIKHEEYNGKVREKIVDVRPQGGTREDSDTIDLDEDIAF
jgi:hypothetical protein